MQDVSSACYRLPGDRGIGEVAGQQLERIGWRVRRRRREILLLAGDKAVNDADSLAALQQGFDEVRTDESGAAGHEIKGHEIGAGAVREPPLHGNFARGTGLSLTWERRAKNAAVSL